MSEKRHDGLRKFNRAIFNPIIKLFAGRFLYSLVFHIGRRSGKEYSTPIVATKKDEFIFIPLPYGANTDWFLNVQAKGKCDVKIKGKLYPSTNPEIVDSTIALSAFPSILQGSFERSSINQYLRLRIN
ncbi:MAG: nitroreductase/quinone reductase family protein [Anaerolineae bacterium]|nr:nitroreductase/quinone reductase family protein [Anaerolineae bacterium]